MIFGVGIDMIEIDRVVRMWEKSTTEKGQNRIFTLKEQEEINIKKRRAASDFAGKEAVLKMFGTGFGQGMEANMVEILRKENGQPYVVLYDKAEEFAKQNKINTIHISITDTKTLVTAIAIGEVSQEWAI